MKYGPLFADILVVDDDPDFVRLVRLVLQSAGYVVRGAGSGEAALQVVRSRPPDLILLDVRLPDLDGYEVARRLKADAGLPFIPIIIITAHARADIAAGLNAGADEFLGKPVENAELLIRVRAMLRLKLTADALAEMEDKTRRLFLTYMPQHVAEMLIADPGRAIPGGQRREITVLFADLEGFTAMAERTPPEQVLEILNAHLSLISNVIIEHGGTVDKFMGDGLMAIFNAPLEQPDHVRQALRAALDIRSRLAQAGSFEPLTVNMGLHVGCAVVGNVGGSHLLNYTAIGDGVNLAKRLQDMAHGGRILASEETVAQAAAWVAGEYLGEWSVQGRQSPVKVYAVKAREGA